MRHQEKQIEITDKLLYRPRTVAALTDQSPAQVYKLIAQGVIRSVRCGRSIRVPAMALREFVEGLEARG